MKRYTITLYHDAVIPPPQYGGTERIVFWLSRALARLGHTVSIICRNGSRVPGVNIIPLRSDAGSFEDYVPSETDILHLWATPHRPPAKPYLVTIEGNGKPGEKFLSNTVFVSRKHAENHGSTYFVYNGIDPLEYPCDEQREPRLVFLAKASWKVKNLQGAIEIARAVGMDLDVLGSRDWPLRLHKILPAWRGVKYHGMVGDQEKRALLRKSTALLFPVRWHEPFGIAITEALASGCAVFGTPYGSLPELVAPHVGFLAASSQEIVDALTKKQFQSKDCRRHVVDRFTDVQMAQDYIKFYEKILSSGGLQCSVPPQAKFAKSSEDLLPYTYLN